jgi:DeoR/GlpR family transcriptional regulator of sugar metabolism
MINRNWLQVKRAIFKSAREVYVLADSSKFGVGYVSVICPANLLKDLLKKSEVISFCPQILSPSLIHFLQPQHRSQ